MLVLGCVLQLGWGFHQHWNDLVGVVEFYLDRYNNDEIHVVVVAADDDDVGGADVDYASDFHLK